MKNPLAMTVDELTQHIERRKRVIAAESAKPKYMRDENYILGLIQKQRMWIAIRASKREQLPLF